MEIQEAQLLSKLMDMSIKRQQTIAGNIANANTPGFLRKTFDFEAEMKRVMETGDLTQLTSVEGAVNTDKITPTRPDGNNVELGREMNDMIENNVYHNLLTRALSTKLRIIRQAMTS